MTIDERVSRDLGLLTGNAWRMMHCPMLMIIVAPAAVAKISVTQQPRSMTDAVVLHTVVLLAIAASALRTLHLLNL